MQRMEYYRCASGRKGVLLLVEALFWFAAMGSHLVYLQYTVTAGMLAGAAIFWVVTAKGKERFWALLFYWLSFCLRPEMALLCLPLAGAGGLCIWGREKQIFSKENLRHYLGLFAALVIGMGVFTGLMCSPIPIRTGKISASFLMSARHYMITIWILLSNTMKTGKPMKRRGFPGRCRRCSKL